MLNLLSQHISTSKCKHLSYIRVGFIKNVIMEIDDTQRNSVPVRMHWYHVGSLNPLTVTVVL